MDLLSRKRNLLNTQCDNETIVGGHWAVQDQKKNTRLSLSSDMLAHSYLRSLTLQLVL